MQDTQEIPDPFSKIDVEIAYRNSVQNLRLDRAQDALDAYVQLVLNTKLKDIKARRLQKLAFLIQEGRKRGLDVSAATGFYNSSVRVAPVAAPVDTEEVVVLSPEESQRAIAAFAADRDSDGEAGGSRKPAAGVGPRKPTRAAFAPASAASSSGFVAAATNTAVAAANAAVGFIGALAAAPAAVFGAAAQVQGPAPVALPPARGPVFLSRETQRAFPTYPKQVQLLLLQRLGESQANLQARAALLRPSAAAIVQRYIAEGKSEAFISALINNLQ